MRTQEKTNRNFPDKFLWGVSTSAYQIESGNINSNWREWEEKKNLSHVGNVCNSDTEYPEDIKLIKALNLNAYRFSIEWSRIEPQEGKWNIDVINYYKDLISRLQNVNIEPFVTLFHFSLPIWISNIGGFKNKKTIKYFVRFVEFVVENLGNKVNFWITINEPTLFGVQSYISGEWPPGEKNYLKYVIVKKNLEIAHIESYIKINKIYSKYNWEKPKISIAKNNIDAITPDIFTEYPLKVYKFLWNHSFLDNIKKYIDFIGLNYYFHKEIKLNILSKEIPLLETIPDQKGLPKQDILGWEIYPKGIYNLAVDLYKRYNKDIYITENGISDITDGKRAEFIKNHLNFVKKAIDEGVPIKGYFYWTLVDNFEWYWGYNPKFGLAYMNKGKRVLKNSSKIYAKIAKENHL